MKKIFVVAVMLIATSSFSFANDFSTNKQLLSIFTIDKVLSEIKKIILYDDGDIVKAGDVLLDQTLDNNGSIRGIIIKKQNGYTCNYEFPKNRISCDNSKSKFLVNTSYPTVNNLSIAIDSLRNEDGGYLSKFEYHDEKTGDIFLKDKNYLAVQAKGYFINFNGFDISSTNLPNNFISEKNIIKLNLPELDQNGSFVWKGSYSNWTDLIKQLPAKKSNI